MKKFVLSVFAVLAVLALSCCTVTGGGESTAVNDSIESVDISTESSVAEQSSSPADSSEQSDEVSEETSEQSLEVTSEEPSEPTSIQPPVESTLVSKEPETIPDLILGPQPEGEYHTLVVGESLQLYSGIVGSELEDAMLKWEVSGDGVIAFGAKCVTALKPGTATVTFSYSNGLKPVSLKFVVIAAEDSSEA